MASIDHLQHILAGNPPADASTCDLRGVDAILGKQFADHGRKHQRIGPAFGRGGGGRSGSRLGNRGRRRSGSRSLRHRGCWRGGRRNGSRIRGRRGGGRSGSRLGRCRGSGSRSRRSRRRRGRLVADDGQTDADFHGLALGNKDLGQYAGGRRRHLGVDLVRRYFEERLVTGDRVADGLHPPSDCSLSHRLAQLRHRDVSQRAIPFRSVPIPSRRTIRTATDAAG
jgi:hypothetical protein